MRQLSKRRHTAIAWQPICATILWAICFTCSAHYQARSQSGHANAAITVSEELRIDADTNAPLLIDVKVGDEAPDKLIVLIRGLPKTIALSHGRVFDSGVWALRLSDLPKLMAEAQRNESSQSDLVFSLVRVDGTVIAQSSAELVITSRHHGGSAGAIQNTQPTATSLALEKPIGLPTQESAPPPLLNPSKPEEAQQALHFMKKADENLQTGKIIVARKFYQRAAESGWAPAALALGKTYDAEELAKMGVMGGIHPDINLARMWYERARDLGLREAEVKLQQIGQR